MLIFQFVLEGHFCETHCISSILLFLFKTSLPMFKVNNNKERNWRGKIGLLKRIWPRHCLHGDCVGHFSLQPDISSNLIHFVSFTLGYLFQC